MWLYRQLDGFLIDPRGNKLAQGYSGFADGKNVPSMQSDADIGPIPRGTYTIMAPVDTAEHGPYVLRLEPDPANQMFGRAGFLIHGDSLEHPGAASRGCIIMPRFARERIWESGDTTLVVVQDGTPVDMRDVTAAT